MSRKISADQENTFLDIGRIIDSTAFQKERKKVYIADISAQIDMITRHNGEVFIAEIKKSSIRMENAILQLKYYLYLLHKRKGLEINGLIKIPEEKKSIQVVLGKKDIEKIQVTLREMKQVLSQQQIPPCKEIQFCMKCAHYEFCWS